MNGVKSIAFHRSVLTFLVYLLCVPAVVYSQSSFYEGKTLTIVQGRRPGGTGDLRVRAIIPFLQKYIPGNPTIVNEYMPGGGGRKVTNFIARKARANGLTIANTTVGTVVNAVVGAPGVQYELDKLVYLGSPYSTNYAVFVTSKASGLDSLEKLRTVPGIRIGGQSVGFITYIEGRVFAYFLDLKDPAFVTGYSGSEMDLALLRNEIDARANSGETLLTRQRDALEKGLVRVHAALEAPKGYRIDNPVFKDLPALESLVKSDIERKALALARSFRGSGTPWVAPPGVPKEHVATLRAAMTKTFKDPEFFKNYKRLTGVEPTPLLPEEQEKAIMEHPRDPEVIKLVKNWAGPGPLLPRQ